MEQGARLKALADQKEPNLLLASNVRKSAAEPAEIGAKARLALTAP
jgi:hypothetical protein